MNRKKGLRWGLAFTGLILPRSVWTAVKMGSTYIRFKLDSRRAAKTFQRELLRQGMNADDAKELTRMYRESADLRGILD